MIATIILAAGSSSRLGASKQLLIIDEETLLERTIKTCLHSNTNKTIVVLGSNAEAHAQAIEHLPIDIVTNKSWDAGIGSSIKAGLHYAMNRYSDLNAVILSVCDQPFLSSAYINSLITHYRESNKTVVASSYDGTIGVPALFDRCHFDPLCTLDDSHGAKKIIETIRDNVSTVAFEDGQIDIDTKEDYQQFINDKLRKK